MRAHTITTTTTRSRPNAWRRAIAIALGVCALAIPATASAYTDPGGYSSANAITGGSSDSSQPVGDSDYSSVNSIAGGSSESSSENPGGSPAADSGYSSLNATAGPPTGEPTVVSGSPADTADGFHWGDAALGAGAAMALLTLGGAAFLTVRRPKPVPASSTSTH